MNETQRKALLLLGLARKARKLEIGEEPCGIACRSGKAKLLLIAHDAGDHTFRRARSYCRAGKPPYLCVPFTKDELGDALGCNACALCAILDAPFAKAFLEDLPELAQQHEEILQELTRQTAQEAGFGLTMDVPEPVWGCVSFYQGQPDELWDGSTVFTLRNVVAETMGADGYLWKLSRVSREDFRWQEDVPSISWDDWADRKTSGEAYLLGRTADAVYLLRFGGGTQLFADVPACAEARADFLAAGRAMLQSFLDQNGIEPNPYWQEIYSQEAAG